jgi:CBS domain-containing protein
MITLKDLLAAKSTELFTAHADDVVASTLNVLAERKIGALLVMDGDKLVGIISERDCAIKVALPGRQASDTKVSEIMTRSVFTVDPTTTLEECMTLMNDKDIRHLPVVESSRVIGMVSIGDVSKELMKEQRQLILQMEEYVRRGFRL